MRHDTIESAEREAARCSIGKKTPWAVWEVCHKRDVFYVAADSQTNAYKAAAEELGVRVGRVERRSEDDLLLRDLLKAPPDRRREIAETLLESIADAVNGK